MGASSKRIGAEAERRVAKVIIATNNALTVEDCRRTGYEQSRKKGVRDLHLSERLKAVFPFSVEVKKLKTWDPFAFMRNPCPYSKWFRQAVEQANNVQLAPLLVVTATNRPCFAVYRFKDSRQKWWPLKTLYPTLLLVVDNELWILTPLQPFAEGFLKHVRFGRNGIIRRRRKK